MLSCNRVSQNLKEEYLDLIGDDYEKEGKNQGKNILTLRVRILTLILTLQGTNSYPDSYPNSYPFCSHRQLDLNPNILDFDSLCCW